VIPREGVERYNIGEVMADSSNQIVIPREGVERFVSILITAELAIERDPERGS